MGTGIPDDSTVPMGKGNSTMTATSTSTGTAMKGRRRRQWVGIEGALTMTGTTTGRGIQRALSDIGNANWYGNSKSAYRRHLHKRVQEFKERLETTSNATGRGIQTALTDDGNGNKNPRTGISRLNSS
jgi:hypothetical protein